MWSIYFLLLLCMSELRAEDEQYLACRRVTKAENTTEHDGSFYQDAIRILQGRVEHLEIQVAGFEEELNEEFQEMKRRVDVLWQRASNATEPGWYLADNGYEYWMSSSHIGYYSTGKEICEDKRARLATIGVRDPEIRSEIVQNVVGDSHLWVWIGLDRLDTIAGWTWLDGVASTSENTAWGPNEPNDSGNERCGQLNRDSNYLINDKSCLASCAALCERKHCFI
uniref:Mannose-binding lectin n=1 Tax=Halocynthia roretzi TaxID=7729 RepID=Q95YN3_HALRO|nr:mannose-binding lectin [Halocynthia roretzi]